MKYIIETKFLSKYYGNKKVLDNVNLQVEPGQIIGYIGPNGAGKSTTVRILTGLENIFDGDVYVKGMDLRKDALEVKKIIGYVPELAELYDVLTPREYLTLVGQLHQISQDEIDKRSKEMLGFFGLANEVDNRMNTFSKGMKQKVLIVSGLIHNPEILFLDEPLTGLDANTVILIKEIISKLAEQGKTIFYCSHMMDVVEKVSDRIIVINEGKIIADGNIDQLRAQSNQSLEALFADLTGVSGHDEKAGEFLDSLN